MATSWANRKFAVVLQFQLSVRSSWWRVAVATPARPACSPEGQWVIGQSRCHQCPPHRKCARLAHRNSQLPDATYICLKLIAVNEHCVWFIHRSHSTGRKLAAVFLCFRYLLTVVSYVCMSGQTSSICQSCVVPVITAFSCSYYRNLACFRFLSWIWRLLWV